MVQVVLWWKITLCVCKWLAVEHVLPMLCRDPGQLELGTTRHSLPGQGWQEWGRYPGRQGLDVRELKGSRKHQPQEPGLSLLHYRR